MTGDWRLSERQRTVLEALARCIVPHAFESGATQRTDLATLVEQRIVAAPSRIRSDLALALRILDSTLARWAIGGRATPWESLGVDDRLTAFSRWGASAIPQARTIHQAVRRLVLATYYTTPEGRADIGVLPPLAGHAPRVAWEGPAELKTAAQDTQFSGDEAIRRVASASTHPVTVPRPAPSPSRAVITPDAIGGDLQLTADVVVIGSGAGGAVAAARLAEGGRQVVILESGTWVPPDSLDEDEARLSPLLFADQGLRATGDLSFTLLQGVGVGGGTRVNWMIMLRTPDHVLEEWQRTFGLTGLTRDALTPVFQRIESELHVVPVPNDAHSPANRVILDGARTLGWRASAATLNARECVRAGSCSLGCRYGAKQDAVATYLPRAWARGATLYANARAIRIEQAERASGDVRFPMKRVHAIVDHPATGALRRTITIRAPIVVLAAGAIETPALLQRSSLGGGVVGRFLRLHPTTCVMGEYDREMYPMAGIPLSAMCDEFIRGTSHDYGFWIEAPALGPMLAAVATSGVGAAHRDVMRRLHRTAPLITLVHDGADTSISNGEVTLHHDGTPRISYRLGPTDRDTLVSALDAATRLHFACGAHEVRTLHTTPVVMHSDADRAKLSRASYRANDIALFSAHVNGTARMGTNRALAAASPEGERYGTRGLYICDGSLLPTALGVNPQETIMALASMVSDGILAHSTS